MKAQSAVLNTDPKIARKREKITKLGSDIGHSQDNNIQCLKKILSHSFC